MKHTALVAPLLFAFALVSHPAWADFSGYYDVSAWTVTTTGTPPAGGSTIDTSAAPASVTIVGGNALCSSGPCTIDLTINAAGSGVMTFDWNYATTDVDGPSYELFFVINGANAVQLSDNGGGNQQSGSESIAVTAGDLIGFRLDCTDCALGPADVTISNFNGPGALPPAPVPTMSTWSLILLTLLVIGLGFRSLRLPVASRSR